MRHNSSTRWLSLLLFLCCSLCQAAPPWDLIAHIGNRVNGLDYTLVEIHGYQAFFGSPSIRIIGGPSAAAGTWLGGKVNMFGAISSANAVSFEVVDGGHLMIRSIWSENINPAEQFLKLTGESTVTVNGASVTGNGMSIDIEDFAGELTITELRGNHVVNISGDCTGGEILIIGMVGYDPYINNTASPAPTFLLLNSMTHLVPPTDHNAEPIAEVGTYSEPFIRSMLEQLRAEQPTMLTATGAGVTDFRLYRVIFSQCSTGLQLDPD